MHLITRRALELKPELEEAEEALDRLQQQLGAMSRECSMRGHTGPILSILPLGGVRLGPGAAAADVGLLPRTAQPSRPGIFHHESF